MGGCASRPKGSKKDAELEPQQAEPKVVPPTSEAEEIKVEDDDTPRETDTTPVQQQEEQLSEPKHVIVPESESLSDGNSEEAVEACDGTPQEEANEEEESCEEVAKEEEESKPEEAE